MMADFRRWSDALVGTLAAEIDVAGVGADLAEMSAFFFTVAEQRRRDPEDDLISAIAAATADGEQLSTMAVALFCILLLVAVNATPNHLIGNLARTVHVNGKRVSGSVELSGRGIHKKKKIT